MPIKKFFPELHDVDRRFEQSFHHKSGCALSPRGQLKMNDFDINIKVIVSNTK